MRRESSRTIGAVAAIAAAGLLAVTPTTASAEPDVPPPGANNWSCRSASHPTPVVLVHGTGANQNQNWHVLAPALTRAGYCVYTVTMGVLPGLPGYGGLDRLTTSTRQLARFVNTVIKRTGSDELDFVGHSQGATLQLSYLRDYGGAKHARRVIDLAGVVSGIPSAGGFTALLRQVPPSLLAGCPSCSGLTDPSTYHFRNYPDIEYTNIATSTDEVVSPTAVSLMKPAPNVRNVLVQSYCPHMRVGHDAMSKSPTVRRIIMNALDPAHRRPVVCGPDMPA
ncbi:esterase/lipase family protein [Gordonia sp. (in: high G+C Gram-positive bacteria)]|uniref:esterase/lipase family protein n=1 Tax=Gordonia sp. (in: high G+C Gram-positive bacteria) TaxID=84139 RepID=UPI0039E6EF20